MNILTNPILISIVLLMILSMMRINVVIALIISALCAGILSDMSFSDTIAKFTDGLGGGAEVAMNYAILGGFAIAISKSGITDLLAYKVIKSLDNNPSAKSFAIVKMVLIVIILAFAISSQNLIPVHIAFIPIIVTPLIPIFNKLKLDRRTVACAITFGLTATYMLLPVGFGKIFIESILVKNINEVGASYGLQTNVAQVSLSMLIPVTGMILGLLVAIFVTYRKPREYIETQEYDWGIQDLEAHIQGLRPFKIIVCLIAIIATFSIQLFTNSTIIGSLAGLCIMGICGIFKPSQSTDIMQQGLQLMAMIGFVMIAASGFAGVINATSGVQDLVNSLTSIIGYGNKSFAALLMLIVGLLITMGIGSSFSTVPIIASIYVPLCISIGFSPLATCSIVGVAAALGDAGSPSSDSTLGPTSGLNVDGKHDHIWDSVIPTFIHYNIPLVLFGWIAAVVL